MNERVLLQVLHQQFGDAVLQPVQAGVIGVVVPEKHHHAAPEVLAGDEVRFLLPQFVGDGDLRRRHAHVLVAEHGEQNAERDQKVQRHADFFQPARLVLAFSAMRPGHDHHGWYQGVKAPENDVGQIRREQVTLDHAVKDFDQDPGAGDVHADSRQHAPFLQFIDEAGHFSPLCSIARTLTQRPALTTANGHAHRGVRRRG